MRLRSVPRFLQGAFRSASRVPFEEEAARRESGDQLRRTRARKLFLLLSRMWWHKSFKRGLVSRAKLHKRFAAFTSGRWLKLVAVGQEADVRCAQVSVRRRQREQSEDLEKRAWRTVSLVKMGEVSTAMQALEVPNWLHVRWQPCCAHQPNQKATGTTRTPTISNKIPEELVALDGEELSAEFAESRKGCNGRAAGHNFVSLVPCVGE